MKSETREVFYDLEGKPHLNREEMARANMHKRLRDAKDAKQVKFITDALKPGEKRDPLMDVILWLTCATFIVDNAEFLINLCDEYRTECQEPTREPI